MNSMKMKKGTVIKEIPENLISDYLKLGWVEVKETKNDKFVDNKDKFVDNNEK